MPDHENTEPLETPTALLPLTAVVAKKTNVPLATVEDIFARKKVVEEVATRRSETLTIRSLKFSGEKRAAVSGNGPFKFEWDGLDTGLWLVLSDDGNQIGKSTILEVMLWALRGSTRGLRPEVRAWIAHVEVVFSIGLDYYCVRFDDHENQLVGDIVRTNPRPARVIDNFEGDEQFEKVMERLMMERFGLQRIPYVNQQSETVEQISHTWTLYAASMFISGSHPAILGDVTSGAAWWRMLQLFIGMPYTGAQMALKSAVILEARRAELARLSVPTPVSRRPEVDSLDSRIEGLHAEIEALSAFAPRPEDTPALLKSFTHEAMECAGIRRSLAEFEHRLSVAVSMVSEASADLRRIEDGSAAKRFFSGLNPVCCPRCAQPFPSERIQFEEEGGSCSVCDRSAPGDDEEALMEAVSTAKERLDVAKGAELEALASCKKLRSELENAEAKSNRLEAEIKRLDQRADDMRRVQELRLELERTRGKRDALLMPVPVSPLLPLTDEIVELQRVLKEAEKQAEARVKSSGAQILDALSVELVKVATRIGYKGLEKVVLQGNKITLTVSGKDGGFTLQTAGQRLRLRIALVIAMMRCAKETSQGHHPGLLFIDSPGAEEVSDNDLNAMMTEIRNVCDEIGNLQIFVSTARGTLVASAVDKKRQRWPNHDGNMF